jgi:hypothetical protein
MTFARKWLAVLSFIGIGLAVAAPGSLGADTINLAGTWRFQSDPRDAGLRDRWFSANLKDAIRLPGSMAENGKSEAVTLDTQWTGQIVDKSWFTSPAYAVYRKPGNIKVPFWLTPDKHYVGLAWYQKEIAVPDNWRGKRVVLVLERCHWETRLWVDGEEAGLRNSLSAPHEYDLTPFLTPGQHILTVRVDNRIKEINVGENAHSVSDHTQTNWNGIIGRIELRAGPLLYLKDVRVFPDVAKKSARISATIGNQTGKPQTGFISFTAKSLNAAKEHLAKPRIVAFKAGEGESVLETIYVLGSDALLWDEFAPNLYHLIVELRDGRQTALDQRAVQFGLREFRAAGTRFAVNGRPIFLRGTLECCIFPKTGYPPTSAAEWMRIFAVCRAHGLNHLRFHSWCPPEAAFDAADRSGFYLYVECPAWTSVGDGKPFDKWLYEESERIVGAYGNHPSFCMMSYGNEPGGKNRNRFLGDFVAYWRKKDGRRVYTSGAGWPQIPESDFHLMAEPRLQRWGEGLNSIINKEAPTTTYDWRIIVSRFDKPVVGHEIGQWCVYPNFKEIPKYSGVLKARNFEIFRDSLAARGLGGLADDFLKASGKLQALCYKADIEAALRTPGFAGFELLDLHDFPGQGTALVGILDAFWEEKGYILPEEFRRFCNTTVPLARLGKMIYSQKEELRAEIETAHFGPAPLRGVEPEWTVANSKGAVVARGKLPKQNISWGNAAALGRIAIPLSGFQAPARYRLAVKIGEFENDWDFWVYPAAFPDFGRSDTLLTQNLDAQAIGRLKKGGRVLLTLKKGAVRAEKGGDVAVGFSSIFWNTAWTNKQPPHTLGILCDPGHPALAAFPTESHSDWQWWDALNHGQAVRLDDFGRAFSPIVRLIDDWFTNRSLGLIFEAKVGKGRILVSAVDLLTNVEWRPEAQQLLFSLMQYAAGPAFNPKSEIKVKTLQKILR